MYVDDELIENLRVALDCLSPWDEETLMTLRTAANEILQQAEASADAARFVDREGDEWFKHDGGHWCLKEYCYEYSTGDADSAHGRPLEYVDRNYGPLKPVD